jgi:hypothetical protein
MSKDDRLIKEVYEYIIEEEGEGLSSDTIKNVAEMVRDFDEEEYEGHEDVTIPVEEFATVVSQVYVKNIVYKEGE